MKDLSKKDLVKIAKDLKLKNYSKLSKEQLIELIEKNKKAKPAKSTEAKPKAKKEEKAKIEKKIQPVAAKVADDEKPLKKVKQKEKELFSEGYVGATSKYTDVY